jgi:hypothetical protein
MHRSKRHNILKEPHGLDNNIILRCLFVFLGLAESGRLCIVLRNSLLKKLILMARAANGSITMNSSQFTALKGLNVKAYKCPGSTIIISIDQLRSLDGLQQLKLTELPRVMSLEPLVVLTNLRHLDWSYLPGVPSLEPLQALTGLTYLKLWRLNKVTSLEPLRVLTGLTHLELWYLEVPSLEPLRALTDLTHLEMFKLREVTSLEPLRALTSLTHIELSYLPASTSLELLESDTYIDAFFHIDERDAR